MHRMRLQIVAVLIGLFPLVARGEFPTTRPWAGVEYRFERRREPSMRLYCVSVDLTEADVSLHVSAAGPDPDGRGRYQTTLMRSSEIAAREGFDITVNGDFFGIAPAQEPGQARYVPGRGAYALGPAMSDGRLWARPARPRPCLVVTRAGRVMIGSSDALPADAREVIGGSFLLVKEGKRVERESQQIAPRTAVGLDREGRRLVILVVDGRMPFFSLGMTFSELADEMIRLGCHTALNLDGGGSSTLVMRNPATGEQRVMNTPSDGAERPVANVLGVRVRRVDGAEDQEGKRERGSSLRS